MYILELSTNSAVETWGLSHEIQTHLIRARHLSILTIRLSCMSINIQILFNSVL